MILLPLLLLSSLALGNANPLLKLVLTTEAMYKIQLHNLNPNRTYDMVFTKFSDQANSGGVQNESRPSNDFCSGDCGSCWAFSAVGALEGQHALRGRTFREFSEQNLVDCSEENSGCGGGLEVLAFDYVKKNGGIDTEDSYPYHGEDEECHFEKKDVGETDEGYIVLPMGDEEALKHAVATKGPISVGIDAKHNFGHYGNGVFYDPECSTEDLDHAVLVVGYGTDPKNGDYWIVKNSWGTTFGEDGFIRMAGNRNNNYGISTGASYPIVQ